MIIRRKRAIGACILASAVLTTVSGCQHYLGAAHAATYYVATTGSNSNPGTEDKPFQTIPYAVDTMVAGDTTYVRGGTYNTTSNVRFRRSGTPSALIQLLNYPGELPIINCVNTSDTNRVTVLFQNQSGYRFAIGWIRFEGFEIKNCWDGIKGYNVHDTVIARNHVHHNVNQGILIPGSLRLTFDRNIINHNGPFDTNPTSFLAHGLYAHGAYLTISNNVIYDNLGYGIQQNGSPSSEYSSTKHPGPEFAGAANWVIASNTIAYQRNRAAIVVWGSQCTNARIENNSFYENAVSLSSSAPQGIHFVGGSASTGIRIRSNHFFASGSGGTQALGGAQPPDLVYTGNTVNVSDPAFVNAPATLPASPNFSLTARSPVIDKGLPLAETRIAFDGTPRPQGRAYDIGAYEYSTGNDAQSPARPAGLQVH